MRLDIMMWVQKSRSLNERTGLLKAGQNTKWCVHFYKYCWTSGSRVILAVLKLTFYRNLTQTHKSPYSTMDVVEVDTLVCGGGMSGMACASFAANAGAKVLVVEKQAEIGGSSKISAGML